jgi:predicted cobalt transporter CbtA
MPLKSLGGLRALLLPALAGGIAAGIVTAILQQIFLVPMILQAEALELGGAEHVHHGLDRVLYTALFDCLGAFGFALLLATAFAYRGVGSWKQGLAWGLAGYASFALAPALGLPPELPGVQSAALIARQVWWVGTALATAAGIASITLVSVRGVRLLGVILLALPHIIGAPGGEAIGAVRDGLARSFALGSLAVSLVMWSTIGIVTVVVMKRAEILRSMPGTASNAVPDA